MRLFYFILYTLLDFTSLSLAKKAFVFSTVSSNWKYYNWKKIDTIVEFGYHDAQLLQHAHSLNVSVVKMANFEKSLLLEFKLIDSWINSQLSILQNLKLDGINIDFEDEIDCKDQVSINAFNYLIKKLFSKMKNQNMRYQLSIDFAWSPKNVDNRCYDYATLAKYVDYVFVMSYDQRSEIFGGCTAWANSAYNLTIEGIVQYLQIGVAKNKIILGLPWYGYDYPCIKFDVKSNVCTTREVPFRQANCSDAVGVQRGFSDIMINYLHTSSSGLLWDEASRTPYFSYQSATGMHEIWFDNPTSLKLKYKLANKLDLLSVGFWEADSLDYSQTRAAIYLYQQMWNSL